MQHWDKRGRRHNRARCQFQVEVIYFVLYPQAVVARLYVTLRAVAHAYMQLHVLVS